MRVLAQVFGLLLFVAPSHPQELKLSKEQQEVWNREEHYWKTVKSRDAEAYLALWHEDFVGWPYSSEDLIHKNDIRRDPFPNISLGDVQSAEIRPKAVQLFGETTVTHYLVTVVNKREDGTITKRAARITHTWMKTRGRWLIIAGMSSQVQPPAPSK